MSNLIAPPQAYTRETLALAFEWLHEQPSSVRETAVSIDAMVALYLQAKRRGFSNFSNIGPEALSTKSFKNDLKNLAENLKQFDDVTGATVTQTSNPQSPATEVPTPNVAPAKKTALNMNSTHAVTISTLGLDPRSLEIIENLRSSLNLSSDSEALRMLISLGFDRIRDILPKP